VIAPQQKPVVPGPKVILLGDPNSGKTEALNTLIESGIQVFTIFTEPGMEVLAMPRRDGKRKVYTCEEGMHWAYEAPVSVGWDALKNIATLMNQFDYKALTNMAPSARDQFKGFLNVVSLMANLTCTRCKKQFGPADQLQPYDKWAVAQDSLSSLSIMALNLLIGTKPAIHEGEWGVAMLNLERYINKFAYDLRCMGVMTAHIEAEPHGRAGELADTVSTLGKKLAPKVIRPFSEVVHTYRKGDTFFWSTITANMKLKARYLPFKDEMAPTFKPIVASWHDQIKREADAQAAGVVAAPA
jgi:hypothetical protein